ncbi:MAG: response regulator transcription factor [Oligoflexia bacterium]|nr:response regulator transcription factor [Oligoflexia bacterium]
MSLISLLTIVDVIGDIHEGLPIKHLIHELGLVFICLSGISYQLFLIKNKNQDLKVFDAKNKELNAENIEFKKQLQNRLSGAQSLIEEMFTKWSLSKGERDIAILLIKGCSMKEIAETRGSSESTVRQQASSIYSKSNLEGRRELTAFFIEDLFN